MRACFTCQGRFEDRRLLCPADGDVLVYEGKPAPETGRSLGAWRLGNLLGEGGMGKVFEAERLDSGAVAAIKVLKEVLSETDKDREQARRRFQVEAEAASALEHPGVVRIQEFSRADDGTSYIVMERFRGATFDELRRAGKFGSAERVLDLMIQVCDVLALAHSKGIVHRDLGFNDNCVYVVTELVESISLRTLLARRGTLPAETARDLVRGAAEALRALHGKGIISGGMSPETLRVSMGRSGPEKLLLTPLGLTNPKQLNLLVSSGPGRDDRSLEYISLEQRSGGEPDPRSDLYSLALILLEMLVGRGPAAEVSPSGTSAEWMEFFRRALASEPGLRFGSAEEFLAALPGRPSL